MSKPSISVFFPCYNDANSIGKLVFQAKKILPTMTDNYEIIVINDGSKDNSLDILREIKQKIPELVIINHSKNRGYGGALMSGFKTATKKLVFYTDGDGQYDVSELPLLLDCLTPDIDVVNGIKMERQDDGLRVIAGNAYRSFVRNLFSLPIYDVDCDFRLIRQQILRQVRLTHTSGAICLQLVNELKKKGARFREVSVHHYPRLHGDSQFFKIKPIVQSLWDLAQYRLFSQTILPFHFLYILQAFKRIFPNRCFFRKLNGKHPFFNRVSQIIYFRNGWQGH